MKKTTITVRGQKMLGVWNKKKEKGTACVLLYVRVPVLKTSHNLTTVEGGTERVFDFKLLKSKLRFNYTKQDVIAGFDDTTQSELDDTFEEDD